MEDLIKFLKICNLQNENLSIQIRKKCESVDQFYDMRDNWLYSFSMNEQEFIKCIKLISFYKQALIDCEEFGMQDIVNTENYPSFLEYVEKYSTFLQDNSLDSDINQVKYDMFKFTYNVYLKSDKNKPNVELLIPPNITNLTTTTTTLLCGASGAALGSLMFPVGTVLGGTAGAALGLYLSLFYVLPFLNDQKIKNFYDYLKEEENFTEDELYEKALDKLNLNKNSSNKLVKNARRNHLSAFHPDKINGDLNLQKELFKLERAYRIIQNYRKNKNVWDGFIEFDVNIETI